MAMMCVCPPVLLHDECCSWISLTPLTIQYHLPYYLTDLNPQPKKRIFCIAQPRYRCTLGVRSVSASPPHALGVHSSFHLICDFFSSCAENMFQTAILRLHVFLFFC